MKNLLSVRDLKVSYKTYSKTIYAVRGVNLDLNPGEVVGVVGESGCGKSAMAKALLRLLPKENSSIDGGHVYFQDRDLLTLDEKKMRKIRGGKISMIFQDPLSALNPTMKIGEQIGESLKIHYPHMSRPLRKAKVLTLMRDVGIPDPLLRYGQFPYSLSGGQRQRIVIAIALACEPKILIADEPTTALDVTIQAQILSLLKRVQTKEDMSIILITHDLSIVAGFCDRVLVMYAGEIVEEGAVEDLFANPKHPYTKRLLRSIPRLDANVKSPLKAIQGHPPKLTKLNQRCSFCPRCKNAMNICVLKQPPRFEAGQNHFAKCWLYDPRADENQRKKKDEALDKRQESETSFSSR